MTDDNTTPRPWTAENGLVVSAEVGVLVADCLIGDGTVAECTANAELIVCAVNTHDDLVMAIKRALEIIEDRHGETANGVLYDYRSDIAMMDAALAKARGA